MKNNYNNFRYEVDHKNSLHAPEQKEAIEKLISMGLLIPFEENNHPALYHGSQSADLKIDEFYKGTASNALAFNGLYTTEDFDLANDTYAKNGGKVYKIVPRRGGGYIFDLSKNFQEDEKKEIWKCIEIFMPKLREIPHDEFLDKKSAENFLKEQKDLLNALSWRYHIFPSYREMEEFKRKSPKEYQMMAKLNTFYYIANNPHRLFALVGLNALNGNQPIDVDFVNTLIEKMWIIGGKVPISSASAGKIIIPVVFSDLSKIQVKEVNEKQKTITRSVFDEIAKWFSENIAKNWTPVSSKSHDLKNKINSPYINIFEIIKTAKSVSPKWKQVFELEVGIWEWYTLEEHTETVLDNFERNFADRIPIGVLGFMRLAILVHDMGKNTQKGVKYDLVMIREFLSEIGVSGELADHIELFVTKSLDFAHRFFVRKDFDKNPQTQAELNELQNMKNGDAMMNLLRIFSISDGGAYTSMGVTHRRIGDLGIIAHRNSPSFNQSFKPPQDIGKRSLDYR